MTEIINKNDPPSRTHTFSWEDPSEMAKVARATTGMEFLTKMLNKEIGVPPLMDMLAFRLVKVEFGAAVFEYEPVEQHYNVMGTVHGGILTALLDTAVASCIHTALPLGVGYTTLEIKVNFVRAVSIKSGVMRCEGKLLHNGSRVTTAEGRLFDMEGKLYAHATTTCLTLQG